MAPQATLEPPLARLYFITDMAPMSMNRISPHKDEYEGTNLKFGSPKGAFPQVAWWRQPLRSGSSKQMRGPHLGRCLGHGGGRDLNILPSVVISTLSWVCPTWNKYNMLYKLIISTVLILEAHWIALFILWGILLQEVEIYSFFPEWLWTRLDGLLDRHQYSLLYSEAK